MICLHCQVQMHQKMSLDQETGEPIFHGDGTAGEAYYSTQMIQVCPLCGRECEEFYSCKVIKDDSLNIPPKVVSNDSCGGQDTDLPF